MLWGRLFTSSKQLKCYKFSFIYFKYFSKNVNARNPYDVLGLKSTCSTKDVKTAYIKLCKELHPDIKPGDVTQHKKFVELNNAYSTLVNESSRKEFDNAKDESTSNIYQHGVHVRQSSSNPSDRTSDPWYERDIYKQERDYFKRQKQNAHVNFRVNQNYILYGCFVLVVLGYALYYAAYSYAKNYSLPRVDERSRRIRESYESTIKKSKENGRGRFLERWEKELNRPK